VSGTQLSGSAGRQHRRELTRLNRIINDMLFLAQVSQPQSQVALKPVALADEVARVVELFAFSAELKALSYVFRAGDSAGGPADVPAGTVEPVEQCDTAQPGR
jgi:signal transduction histidine kinase